MTWVIAAQWVLFFMIGFWCGFITTHEHWRNRYEHEIEKLRNARRK